MCTIRFLTVENVLPPKCCLLGNAVDVVASHPLAAAHEERREARCAGDTAGSAAPGGAAPAVSIAEEGDVVTGAAAATESVESCSAPSDDDSDFEVARPEEVGEAESLALARQLLEQEVRW